MLAVNNLNFLIPKVNETQPKGVSYPHFGLSLPKPISCDTVSFKGKVRLPKEVVRGVVENEQKGKGILYGHAREIYKEAKCLQSDITAFFQENFKDLVATKEHPDRPILLIKGRAKTPSSIQLKSEELKIDTTEGIFANLTDLNGVKIILRDASPKQVKKVLNVFAQLHKKNSLILGEIETKRPIVAKGLKGREASKWDYYDPDELTKYVEAINETSKNQIELKDPAHTRANYTALHLLARFPGTKRFFEIQLMGKDVAAFKDFDDIIYKILDNKSVDPCFEPIVEKIKELKEPGNEEILENFKKQRKDTFLFQREKEPTLYERTRETFLPLKYDIPEKYDINKLYEEYQEYKSEFEPVVETILGSTDENVIKQTKRRKRY